VAEVAFLFRQTASKNELARRRPGLAVVLYLARWCWLQGSRRSAGLDLRSNQIRDIAPLVSNDGFGSKSLILLAGNPLNDEAYDRHIPALLKRGVVVSPSRRK
jgi:hypothetical protein